MTEPATIVELISALRKKPRSNTSWKFARSDSLGKYWTGVLKSSESGVNAERTAQ